MSDSEKVSEASRSPAKPLPAYPLNAMPNEKVRDLRHSLFSSDEEYDG